MRLTVEQNIILPNVKQWSVDSLVKEKALAKKGSRLKVHPGKIEGNVVSCTGAQFCGLALIETKSNAEALGPKLEELVDVPQNVRIHWTGCPNSCGQVQAADIGIMYVLPWWYAAMIIILESKCETHFQNCPPFLD